MGVITLVGKKKSMEVLWYGVLPALAPVGREDEKILKTSHHYIEGNLMSSYMTSLQNVCKGV